MRAGFRRLRLAAPVGAYDEERHAPQEILVSVEFRYRRQRAAALAARDDLAAAHDYAAAAELVRRACEARHHDLLENLGLELARELSLAFPDCAGIEVEIEKPSALPGSQGSYCRLSASPQ